MLVRLQLLIQYFLVIHHVLGLWWAFELLLGGERARAAGANALVDQYVLLFLKEIWRYASAR